MEIRPSLVIYEIRGGLLKHKKSPKHKPRVCAPSLTLITPPSLASATANLDLRSFFTIDFVRNFFRLLPIWRIEKRSAGHCRGFSSHLNISQRYIYIIAMPFPLPTFPSMISVVAATASAVPSNAEKALSFTILATLSADDKLEASLSGSLLDPLILKMTKQRKRML